ncbi:unnamed protein product [Coregonus sp. 'balchen']|nr:unnamed protein product [Coregonus sp. 'balchen']
MHPTGPTHQQSITSSIGAARRDRAQSTTPHRTTTFTRPEAVPRPRPGSPPLHGAQQQDQRSYAEALRGQENAIGWSEIKQLLQYICTKLH